MKQAHAALISTLYTNKPAWQSIVDPTKSIIGPGMQYNNQY